MGKFCTFPRRPLEQGRVPLQLHAGWEFPFWHRNPGAQAGHPQQAGHAAATPGGPGGRPLPARTSTPLCPPPPEKKNALRRRLRLARTIAELRDTLRTVWGEFKTHASTSLACSIFPNYCSDWRHCSGSDPKSHLKRQVGKKTKNTKKQPDTHELASRRFRGAVAGGRISGPSEPGVGQDRLPRNGPRAPRAHPQPRGLPDLTPAITPPSAVQLGK